MKEYVVIKWVQAHPGKPRPKVGQYECWATYPGWVWGSPAYEVMGYFPSIKAARQGVREMKAGTFIEKFF